MSVGKAALNALGKIADEVVEVVSPESQLPALSRMGRELDPDWKWTGGKPGELTGGQFVQQWDETDKVSNWKPLSPQSIPPSIEELDRSARAKMKLLDKALSQLSSGGITTSGGPSIKRAMLEFADLERAGVPREWTGKILRSLGGTVGHGNVWKIPNWLKLRPSDIIRPEELAPALSDTMRGLYVPNDPATTKLMRESFLDMLPGWSGSLDELADTVRALMS